MNKHGQAAIATYHLTKRYNNRTVINHLNLSVPQRTVYGFLGPNGAGKTTTMKMILGLAHPSDGEAEVLGTKITTSNRLDVLCNVGSLIENPSCYTHLTAEENLDIIRRLRGLPKSEIKRVLDIVRLHDPHTLKKRTSQFSLGMKQRLGIAMALMGNPPLLLLDEPTNGLDPSGIHEIRALIKQLPELLGTTVLVSSHLLSEIDQMADHVGIIREGSMVWEGSLIDLHKRARRWIALRTTDNTAAAEILKGCHNDDNGWLILNAMDDHAASMMSLNLAQHGIGIIRMEEKRESLEDIFLSLTGMEASL